MEKPRVPPGQKVSSRLKRLDLGVVPAFNEEKWRLRIKGLVERPIDLTYKEVLALPSIQVSGDFHCVTGWSRLDNKWKGVAFKKIIELVHPKPEAKFVTFESSDGYTTSLPLSDLASDDVLLAYDLDNKRLSSTNGGPLRLVVPAKYAYKSAKWIQGIRFTIEKVLGYWEQRGYSDTADPWTEDRYSL